MRAKPLTILLAAAGLAGCSEPSHLIHYHKTVVGFSASASTDGGGGHLGLAYSRKHSAAIPKTEVGGKMEAMSVLFCTDVTNGFSGPVQFKEVLATGDAAQAYAQRYPEDPGRSPFNCFEPKETGGVSGQSGSKEGGQ